MDDGNNMSHAHEQPTTSGWGSDAVRDAIVDDSIADLTMVHGRSCTHQE